MFGAAMLPLEVRLAGLLTDAQKRNAPQSPNRSGRHTNTDPTPFDGRKIPKKTGRGDYPPLTNLGHIEVRRRLRVRTSLSKDECKVQVRATTTKNGVPRGSRVGGENFPTLGGELIHLFLQIGPLFFVAPYTDAGQYLVFVCRHDDRPAFCEIL